jgi:diguanylate cyclase (GGDEF)-like protein/PAS domain S-box-containing protein
MNLAAVFSALPDDVFLLDWDGRYLEVPEVPAAMLSRKGRDLVGQYIRDLFPPDTADMFLGSIRRAISSGQVVQTDYVLHGNGVNYWYSASVSPVSDSTVLWVARDVTEKKRAERIREVFAWLGAELSSAVSAAEAARTALLAAEEIFGWDAGFLHMSMDPSLPANVMRMYSLVRYDRINGERHEIPSPDHYQAGPFAIRAIEGGAFRLERHEAPADGLVPFGDTEKWSRSLMFVPIRYAGVTTGVMSIQSYTEGAYSEQDLEVLQTLSDFCSGALQRTLAEKRMQETQQARRDDERRFQALLENSNDAVLVMDANAHVKYVSPAIQRVLGFSAEDYLKIASFDLLHPDDRERAENEFKSILDHPGQTVHSEFRLRASSGEHRWIETATCNLLGDPAINGIVCNLRDVTERHAAEQKLKYGAYHDSLTELANRPAFIEHLQRALARHARNEKHAYAVLFLDVDRFKVVNDSLGHLAGDRLLVQVAERLVKCLRSTDIAARLGGDEFAVLVEDADPASAARHVAERIQHSLTRPFTIDGAEIFSSASIGIALSEGGYSQPDEVLRDADTAMYRAKGQGKGRYAIFDMKMHEMVAGQLQMETDLRRAIERNELLLYYQPVVSLHNGHVVGFEALVRWQHPERGMVMPSDFIPLAEETDLIADIGWWVLREACRWMRRWQLESSFGRRLSINVNLSARQFAQPDLVEQIESTLRETGLDPRCLKLEITETTIVENGETAIEMLGRLKELQVQLHVDDFGTGYSSLAYLHRFPIDALKIDRTFVQNLGKSEEALEISRAVIALARNMKMDPIAEGIETPQQLQMLSDLGCSLGQGFFFSRPLPGDQARMLFDRVFACQPSARPFNGYKTAG